MSLEEEDDGTKVEINLIILFSSKEDRGRNRRFERTKLTRTRWRIELRPVNFERGEWNAGTPLKEFVIGLDQSVADDDCGCVG